MVCLWSLAKTKILLEECGNQYGVHVVFVHILFLLGEGITKEAVDALDWTRFQALHLPKQQFFVFMMTWVMLR